MSEATPEFGAGRRPLLVCVQCGFTHAEFRARGLLGCPACYDHFNPDPEVHSGDSLFADMLHIHPRLYRRAQGAATTAADDKAADRAAALRERLSDALRLERYEEAAALRGQLDAYFRGPQGSSDPSPGSGDSA